jgi:hypothetical protein
MCPRERNEMSVLTIPSHVPIFGFCLVAAVESIEELLLVRPRVPYPAVVAQAAGLATIQE